MKVAFLPLGPSRGSDSVVITEFPVVLARSSRSDLAPEGFTVSPCHCEIDAVDGVLYVRDLGSRHGTFVNESRVIEACLWPGSKLTVGLNSFSVSYNISRHRTHPTARRGSARSSPIRLNKNLRPGIDMGNVQAFNPRGSVD